MVFLKSFVFLGIIIIFCCLLDIMVNIEINNLNNILFNLFLGFFLNVLFLNIIDIVLSDFFNL